MSPAATQNYFELFQLPQSFQIDMERLDGNYREIQGRVHPDKAANLSDAEKRLYVQWATYANEAYRILRKPLDRARYLLQLQGVELGEETNTVMPPEFLLEQIEWREEMQQARTRRSPESLDRLFTRLRAEMNALFDSLASLLDVERQYPAAADAVRQLAFLEKLARDLEQAQAELEE